MVSLSSVIVFRCPQFIPVFEIRWLNLPLNSWVLAPVPYPTLKKKTPGEKEIRLESSFLELRCKESIYDGLNWKMIMLLYRSTTQSIPVSFRICINLIHFTRSNAFCQSLKHHTIHHPFPKFVLILFSASQMHPYFLNPNWSFSSTSSIFLSVLLLSILVIIFAVCPMRKIVRWSLHFVAFGFFFNAIIVASTKSLGHSPFSHMLLNSCVIILRPSSPKNLSTSSQLTSYPSSPW